MTTEFHDPDTTRSEAESEGGVSLTLILNIFWRRRWTVVLLTGCGVLLGLAYSFLTPPEFQATGQVRPGIVAYSDQGGPVREWQLKDVVRWFRTELYWPDLRDDPQFERFDQAPVIDAEFIPQGPQSFQGGDVILLDTFSPEPLEAIAILEQAIASFNRQASQDTIGSTLHLTIGGARLRIDQLRNEQEDLEIERAQIGLSVGQLAGQLALVDTESKRYDLAIAKLTRKNAQRELMITATEDDLARSQKRFEDAEAALASLLHDRTDAVGLGELLGTVNDLSAHIFRGTLLADSLRSHIEVDALEVKRLAATRDVEIGNRRLELQQQIAELELQRQEGLASKYRALQQRIASEEIRLGLLTPLERIGRIAVTNEPVRPRKLQATLIATLLGFFSALFFVLGWEYYSRNRTAITAPIRPQ